MQFLSSRKMKSSAMVATERSSNSPLRGQFCLQVPKCKVSPSSLAAARRVKLWSLNANLFFEGPHQLTKFA